jgi:nucleoside-diphosphate-sugar epimerase
MTKVLITGANGFIGKRLFELLSNENYQIYLYTHKDGNIEIEETWNNFEVVDIVIHLAGKSFVPDSWSNISDFFNTNLIGTTEALKYCKKHGSKLLFLSTYMYGNPDFLPIKETHKIDATNPYTLSKKFAEEACMFYNNNFGVDITILRPFNVFGSGQSKNFIISKIIKEMIDKKSVNLSDLTPKRDFIYIDDLINAIILSIKNIDGLQIYNVGSGISISIRDLVNTIFKLTDNQFKIVSDNVKRKGEIKDCYADITKIKNNLNWQPDWSLEMGLKEILKSIKLK